MWIDLTVAVTPELSEKARANEKMTAFGHLGTHFDVMNLTFPLENARRSGLVLDVTEVAFTGQEVSLSAEALNLVQEGDFVIFRTGRIENVAYGSEAYFGIHPQLEHSLIDALIEKKVAMIGIDAAGIRRGSEHTPMDQYCADRGVFVVENLCNLGALLQGQKHARFEIFTFPIKFEGMSGLPCRVMALVEDVI
ncbi:cyclase family protein [Acidaminobacter hydrogenoformans]|uniref:Kynurenine formamidase n=1 Tax=Acidaminobacter hydrogenoformans DSM 2784 TaxID=1120920 RepID=A0A1G5RXV5_9FIRM|nr:cyclase family protein [Acidaminobacter hydrogenoformans]SCZ78291.1 Kynurenine formamidase [Acidaminobacter hydrogenoformans DSM 2784]